MQDMEALSLQGANFLSPASLKIMESRAALVFGRNGSGKSTIAKAFRKIAGEHVPSVVSAEITGHGGGPVILSEEEKKKIFVFDEDFVAQNVRVEGDALGSIVMLGEHGDLSVQIKSAEQALASAQQAVECTKEALKEFEGDNSPEHCLEDINRELRKKEGWADRDKKIKNNAQKSKVGNETYKRFVKLSPSKSQIELAKEFYEKLAELNQAKSGEAVIVRKVPEIPEAYKTYSVRSADELLRNKIEPPELTEREQLYFTACTGRSGACSQ